MRQLFSSTEAITDTYDYDAFGNLIASTGTTPNNYLFAGERFDPALGLYCNRARYLNTNTGRFWTSDPFEGAGPSETILHKYLYGPFNLQEIGSEWRNLLSDFDFPGTWPQLVWGELR